MFIILGVEQLLVFGSSFMQTLESFLVLLTPRSVELMDITVTSTSTSWLVSDLDAVSNRSQIFFSSIFGDNFPLTFISCSSDVTTALLLWDGLRWTRFHSTFFLIFGSLFPRYFSVSDVDNVLECSALDLCQPLSESISGVVSGELSVVSLLLSLSCGLKTYQKFWYVHISFITPC